VLSTTPHSDAARLRCDRSPTERSWGFDAWRPIGRLLDRLQPVERTGWRFTEEELPLAGQEMEEAITIARGLVDNCTAGRFRPQAAPEYADPLVRPPRFGHQTRMERTDQ